MACFGVAQAIATAVPIAPCDKRIPMGFNGHIECPLTRKAAARQPWTMEYFPFREWLWRMADFALLEMLGDRMRMRFRSRRMDCPLGRFLFDACPVERTQRSAPPATRGLDPFSAWCGGRGLAISMQGGLAAQGDGVCPIQAQWSGHGGPRSCHPSVGPTRRVVWRGMD